MFTFAIIRDPVVTILAQNYMRNTRHLRSREERSVMKAGTRGQVIRDMPKEERAALRDRVLGVVQLPTDK